MAQALAEAMAHLKGVSSSPRLDAEVLAAHALGKSRGSLFAYDRDVLAEDVRLRLLALIEARGRRMPVAYLTGEKEFWSLTLRVTPDVLVPRPETERLVEWALQLMAPYAAPQLLDLGTGSGAIALALARELPRAGVVATDISDAALDVAADNAKRNGLASVRFLQGEWWSALQDAVPPFDLIVSNPPYIAAGDEHLDHLLFEPRVALTDENDGLDCLRRIIGGAEPHLRSGGWLLVEHGYDQGAAVRALFRLAGLVSVETRRDLAGHERATGGQRP